MRCRCSENWKATPSPARRAPANKRPSWRRWRCAGTLQEWGTAPLTPVHPTPVPTRSQATGGRLATDVLGLPLPDQGFPAGRTLLPLHVGGYCCDCQSLRAPQLDCYPLPTRDTTTLNGVVPDQAFFTLPLPGDSGGRPLYPSNYVGSPGTRLDPALAGPLMWGLLAPPRTLHFCNRAESLPTTRSGRGFQIQPQQHPPGPGQRSPLPGTPRTRTSCHLWTAQLGACLNPSTLFSEFRSQFTVYYYDCHNI
ncbi:LOW QUALITY PROTEIN: transcription factor SOX-17-like [Rhinolophus sinicus]|uniref:LOW QUALITY PROTEIN: transcription factor SOX-17-like n=1 Tax=Rhinolophus sinicus TaxID=89399 RepID=UPI003D7AF5C7